MSEKCTLKLYEGAVTLGPDEEGVTWERGLPDACRECLREAFNLHTEKAEYFTPELDEGEDMDAMEMYAVEGLQRLDSSSKRTAIIEVGINDDHMNNGRKLSLTSVEFHCPKN